MRPLSHRSILHLVALMAVLATACGSDATSVTSSEGEANDGTSQPSEVAAEATEPTPVIFRLDYAIGGEHCPYVLGLDEGFFDDEGLDVNLQEGSGSSTTVQLVANETVDFGNANTPPVVFGIEAGAPIRMVANMFPTSGFGLIWVKGETPDLASPQDVAGLRLGTFQGGAASSVLGLMLEQNDVDPEEVDVVQGPPPTSMHTALLQDRIDAILGVNTMLTELEEFEPDNEYGFLDLADFGIDIQAHGIIVNENLIEESPEVVTSFVRAAQRSWDYVLNSEENQKAAVEACKDRFPEADGGEAALTDALALALTNLRDGGPAGELLGFMTVKGWEASQTTMTVLENEAGTEISSPIEDYYTNEFLSDDFVLEP